jgi:purine-binding chemotaxis protein CheW
MATRDPELQPMISHNDFRTEDQTPQAPTPEIQIVVCVVAGERYGIEVSRILEIIRLPPITSLPGSANSVTGVINLRGRIVPVVDLRERLGLPAAPPSRFTRIVVAHAEGTQLGLVVDAVDEVIRIPQTAIEPAGALAVGAAAEHLVGIARSADGLVILLDLERLLAGSLSGAAAPTATAPAATAPAATAPAA